MRQCASSTRASTRGAARRRSPVGGIRVGLDAIRRSVKTAIRSPLLLLEPRSRNKRAALAHQMGERRDQQAGKPADQRAVDADVLEIGPNVALKLADELLLLPAHDLVLDEAADLRTVLLHDERRAVQDLLVEPRLHLAIGA